MKTLYHKRASARLRLNQIKVNQHNGVPHHSQEAKQSILASFYERHHGKRFTSLLAINFQALYIPWYSDMLNLRVGFTVQRFPS
jgi:hypothetical protein